MNMTVDDKYMESMITDHGDDLCHYGREGQKWGVRRYQYLDGRLTPLGRLHYGISFKNIGQVEAARRKNEEEKAKKRADEIERVTRFGNAEDIYRIRETMTDQELTRAVQRMNATRQLEAAIKANADKIVPEKKEKKSIFQKMAEKKQSKLAAKLEADKKVREEQAEQQKKIAKAIESGTKQLSTVLKAANTVIAATGTVNKLKNTFGSSTNSENNDSSQKNERSNSGMLNPSNFRTDTSDITNIRITSDTIDRGSGILSNVIPEVEDYIIPSGGPEPFKFDMRHGDNMNENWMITDGDDCICHYGVKGMKWHKHLFRKTNSDGSLTIFGKMGKKERQRMSAFEQEKTYSDLNRGVGNYDAERAIRRAHDAEKGIKGTESDALAKRRSMDLRRGAANAKTMKAHQDNVNKKARQRKIAQAQANTIKAGHQQVKKMLDKVHKDQRSFKRSTANADTMIASAKKRIEKYSNRVVWGLYDTQSKASRIYVTNQKVR